MSTDLNGNDMAFPCEIQTGESNGRGGMCTVTSKGLTKREWFAGMALSGFLANSNIKTSIDDSVVSRVAFEFADAMMEEGAK